MATAGVKSVLIRFQGDATGLNKTADKAAGRMDKFKGGINKASKAIVAGAAAAGAGLVAAGAQFDEAFDAIRVGTGATGEAMKGLQKDFKAAMAETPADMQVVADAMANLNTMTGTTGETLQGLTVQVTEASRLLGEDAAGNAEAFGQALQQWQIPAEEGQGHLDTLFKATQDYGVGLDEIVGQLNTYGSVLQNAGFSMEESAALFGSLNKAGLDVSRVMPGLNAAFRTWADEGKNVQGELSKTVDEIANAKDSTAALSIATEAFGAEGAQRMTTAIRSGAVSLEDLSSALDGADGLIGETADGTDSWQEKLQKLKNQGLAAIEPLATAFFDKLDSGIDLFKQATDWAGRNAGTVKALAIALGVIAATIVAVNVGIKIFNGIMALWRAAVAVATAVQWAWNIALNANPLGLIVIAIAAVVGGLILLYKNSETAKKIMDAVFKAIVAVVKWWFENIVKRYFAAVKAAFLFLVDLAKKWWEAAKKYFGFWKGLLEKVKGWVTGAKDRIVESFNTVIEFIRNIQGKVESALSGLGDAISAPFRAGFEAAKDFYNSTIGGKGFDIPSWVPGVGGNSFRFPTFHQGGIVPGRLGQEVPILARAGEQVLTREQQQEAGTRVDKIVVQAWSDRFSWPQVERELAMHGVV